MYIPKDIWLVKHHSRDISFFVPKPDEEVNTTQATFEKRQSTALNWARGDRYSDRVPVESLTQHEFQNDFTHGFKFITTSSRWQTEAEYIVIRHPNGYSFEIYTSNLLEVLRADGCSKGGVLNGKYKMFYNMNGKWSIFSEGSSLEPEMNKLDAETRKVNASKKLNKSIKLVEGMVVSLPKGYKENDVDWVYVGRHELEAVGTVGEIHIFSVPRKHNTYQVFSKGIYTFSGGGYVYDEKEVYVEGKGWGADERVIIGDTVNTSQTTGTLDMPKLLTFVSTDGRIAQYKSKSVYIEPKDGGTVFNHDVVKSFKAGALYQFSAKGFDYSEVLRKHNIDTAHRYGSSYYGLSRYKYLLNFKGKGFEIGDQIVNGSGGMPFDQVSTYWGFEQMKDVKLKIKESK